MIKRIIIVFMIIALISIILDFVDVLVLNNYVKAFCYIILALAFSYIGFYKDNSRVNE